MAVTVTTSKETGFINVSVSPEEYGKLMSILTGIEGSASDLAREIAEQVRNVTIERTPVGILRGGLPSGRLKRSWSQVSRASGTQFTFTAGQPYARTLEEGLYKKLGPRTVAYGSGIYSSQAPGGIVKPIFEGNVPKEQSIATIVAEAITVFIEGLTGA